MPFIQIIGEIKTARDALVEVTTRLRSYLYRDFSQKETPPSSISVAGPAGSVVGTEAASPNNITPAREAQIGGADPSAAQHQNVQTVATLQPSKVVLIDGLVAVFLLIFVSSFLHCILFNSYYRWLLGNGDKLLAQLNFGPNYEFFLQQM